MYPAGTVLLLVLLVSMLCTAQDYQKEDLRQLRMFGKALSKKSEAHRLSAIEHLSTMPAAVPRLTPLLKDPSAAIRRAAMDALLKLKHVNLDLVPLILEWSKDKDEGVRLAAVRCIGALGPAADKDLAMLAGALKDPVREVRMAAVVILGEFGKKAASIVPRMLDAAHDVKTMDFTLAQQLADTIARTTDDPAKLVDPLIQDARSKEHRRFGCLALDALGQSTDDVLSLARESVKDPDPVVRTAIARILGRSGTPGDITLLTAMVHDDKPVVRAAILGCFGALGAKAKDAIPTLVRILQRPDTQDEAIAALGLMGRAVPETVPAVVELLAVTSNRVLAVRALGAMGPGAEKSLPNLLDGLKVEDVEFKSAILVAIARIAPQDSKMVAAIVSRFKDDPLQPAASAALDILGVRAMPALRKGLKVGEPEDRVRAAVALGKLGVKAADTVSDILDLIRSPIGSSLDLEYMMPRSLGRMGPTAVPALLDLAKAAEFPVRRAAIIALGQFPESQEQIVPTLIRTLAHPDLGATAAEALGAMGSPAGPPLLTFLNSPETAKDRVVRKRALGTIGRLEKPPVNALPAIKKILGETDTKMTFDPIVTTAIAVLGRYGAAAKEFVPFLIEICQNNDYTDTAAKALASIGPDAVPELTRALGHARWDVRWGAVQALIQIAPDSKDVANGYCKLLKGDDFLLRALGADGLAAMGPAGKAYIAEIRAATKNLDAEWVNRLSEAINKLEEW